MSASPSGATPAPNSVTASNLEHQRKLAKDLLKAARSGDAHAVARIRAHVHGKGELQLADAQLAIAREAGFDSWPKLVHELEKAELQAAASALHRGDAVALRKILQVSPSVRKKINDPLGPFGARPIQMASKHRDVLDVLIDFGADVNLRSDWEAGPFGVLDSAPEEVACHLLTRGAVLTAHAAARLGWLDELKKIVEANPAVVHEKGGDGQRPLHFAKNVEIAEYLLSNGAEIDARDVDHHSTPAQYALAERPDVCRFLLQRGATPDIFMPARLGDLALAQRLIDEDPSCLAARINWPGYPPVPPFNIYCWSLGFYSSPHEVAIEHGRQDVYKLLVKHSPPIVRFLSAAWSGDEPGARAILSESPQIIASMSPQHHGLFAHAVHHQRDEAVRLMLEVGFDPAAPGTDGGTALHQAAWVGRPDYVELLRPKAAAIINEPDPTHKGVPIGWAAYGSVHRCNPKGDYVRTIELLAAAGAHVGPALLKSAEGNPTVQEALRRLMK
jgi:ankyrin repeat protein